jgi:hypothetical protein
VAAFWYGLTRGRDGANPCGYSVSERGRNVAFDDRRSENVNAQHPPHEEQGDDGHHHVANPLPDGFRLGAVLHGLIVAGWSRWSVAALQRRWDRLCAGLDLILDQRGADMADLPGGESGMPAARLQAQGSLSADDGIAPGVVSLFAELRGHERQATEELGQWKTHHEERKVIDASQAAITLAILLTDEELDAARHGEPAQVFPANAAPPDGRPRLDGVIGWSRIRAVGGGAADGGPSLSRFPPLEPGSDPRSTGPRYGRSARRRQRDTAPGLTRAGEPIGW